LNYAIDAINFLMDNLWESNFEAFVDRAMENGTMSSSTSFTLTDQAATLLALSKQFNITGNVSLVNNFIVPIINFVKIYLWNQFYNQFYSTCELDGTNPSTVIRPSDLSIWLYALSTTLDYLNDDLLEFFLIKSLIQLNTYGWDPAKKAFNRQFDHDGTLLDSSKWTIEQVIPLFLFSIFLRVPNNIQLYIFVAFFIGTATVLAIVISKYKKTKELTRFRITR